MKKYYVGLGRMNDYKHEAPERTAYKVGASLFSDYEFIVFPSRQFMANAVKKGGLTAVVKDKVEKNMLIYSGLQEVSK